MKMIEGYLILDIYKENQKFSFVILILTMLMTLNELKIKVRRNNADVHWTSLNHHREYANTASTELVDITIRNLHSFKWEFLERRKWVLGTIASVLFACLMLIALLSAKNNRFNSLSMELFSNNPLQLQIHRLQLQIFEREKWGKMCFTYPQRK